MAQGLTRLFFTYLALVLALFSFIPNLDKPVMLRTREEMSLYVFEYIESWYNHKRRFSALGQLTIDEFWKQYWIKNESNMNVA